MGVQNSELDEHARPIKALLVLEPIGGGGDLQQIEGVRRIVEQLKADSSPGPWSLTVVVREVLPDLYLAIDDRYPDTDYRLVTEGRIGRWGHVYEFFRSLRTRRYPAGNVLACLDDEKPIFHPKKARASDDHQADRCATSDASFWEPKAYTERTLFERIVKEVRQRKKIKDEDPEVSRIKVWNLLGRFKFIENQTVERLKGEIDQFLKEVIDATTNLQEKRNALVMDLATKATAGGARLEAKDFFTQHGLNASRLSDLAALQVTSYRVLERRLLLLGYNSATDVRRDRVKSIIAQWTIHKPVLILKGESGQGKSWLLFGVSLELAGKRGSVIVVESRGDADADQQRSSDVYWRDVKGNNDSIPLDRLAALTKQSVKGLEHGWLTIGIDGVQSHSEGRSLALEDWEGRLMKLVISCTPEVADTVQRIGDTHRYLVVDVDDFSFSELSSYLENRLGEDWADIPSELRNTLRRPLLARIYGDIVPRGPWRPTDEFALLERYWRRLREGEEANYPSDIVGIRQLALSILTGKRYPWTEEQVTAELSDAAVSRLVRLGFLRRSVDGRYEIWHDRLLNWLVAESLVSSVRRGELSVPDFCSHVHDILTSEIGEGRIMSHTTSDLLWLLLEPECNEQGIVAQIMEELEGLPWTFRDEFLRSLVPKVGSRIVPVLGVRIEAVAAGEDKALARQYIDAMTAIEADEVSLQAIHLLDSESPTVKRMAACILT